jgi:PST family polysaccharide transporter
VADPRSSPLPGEPGGEGVPVTPEGTLGARIARGAAWIAASRVVVRLIGLVNTIVLARLLIPEDFGIVAIGATVMQLLQNVSDIGVSHTVVRYRNASAIQIDTLFTLSLLRGVVVMALLVACAPIATAVYGDPRIGEVFIGLSLVPLLYGLVNPRFYEFERDLDFSRESIVAIVAKIASITVSISIAVAFQTYWALVFGMVAGVLINTLASYIYRPYRPRLALSGGRELIGFTGSLTALSALVAFNNKLDPLILGRLLGTAPTGTYSVGSQLAALPSYEIATPIARALYPGLASLQHDQSRMRDAYLRGAEALAAVALPAALGLAFVAQDFVLLVLGENWQAVVPVIQIFAPVLSLLTIYSATQGFAMAIGKTAPLLWREIISLTIRLPIFVTATIIYGYEGALWSAAFGMLLYTLLQGQLYSRISGGPWWEPMWRSRRSLAAGACMAIYFLALRPLLDIGAGPSPMLRLALDVTMGGVMFIGAHALCWHAEGRPDGVERIVLNRLRRG